VKGSDKGEMSRETVLSSVEQTRTKESAQVAQICDRCETVSLRLTGAYPLPRNNRDILAIPLIFRFASANLALFVPALSPGYIGLIGVASLATKNNR